MDEFTLELGLHQAQLSFVMDEHKYVVVDAGRQFGKSEGCSSAVVIYGITYPNSTIWIISPTYKQSAYMFKKIVKLLNDNNVPIKVKKTPQDMSITILWNNSTITALSADNPDNLRGATLDFLVFDEVAMVADDRVWYEVLMPMCWKPECKVRFISTPKGKNWFYDLYNMEKVDPEWKSYHFTSMDNPFIPPSFIESMRRRLDKDTFNQEILGEFIDNGGIVFYDYEVKPYVQKNPSPTEMYIAGIDLAKSVDFTVVTILNVMTGEFVYTERWQKETWDITLNRIKSIHEEWNNCFMLIDSTGVGDPIVERLQIDGVNCQGFVFSSKSKPQIVRNLVAMLQSNELYLPDIEYYKDEFERFSYNVTAQGNIQYSAPIGYHDDCVMSYCLAAWALVTSATDIGFVYENTLNDNPSEFDEFAVHIDDRAYGFDMDSYEDSLKYFE